MPGSHLHRSSLVRIVVNPSYQPVVTDPTSGGSMDSTIALLATLSRWKSSSLRVVGIESHGSGLKGRVCGAARKDAWKEQMKRPGHAILAGENAHVLHAIEIRAR